MKNQEKYHDAIAEIDPSNETAIKNALEKAGLYSNLQIFPLATLHLELTEHCNAACKHCYNNSGTQNGISDAMTPENWISFVKYLVKLGGVFECIISGGEPLLLGEALYDIMDVLHNDGTLFLLQTNGYLLTKDVVARLKKYHYHYLQVSIDGVNAEYHDSFRQKRGSWEKAIDAASMVAQNEIPLKIAHCVTPYNLQDIDEMCALAYSLGASAITIGEVCLSGRVAQNRDLLLSAKQREVLTGKVKENHYRYRGRMQIKTSNSVRFGLERQRKRPYSRAFIRPNGDIRIDGMAPFVIGNILAEDFMKAWAEKIDAGWKDQRVTEFISNFAGDDRNYSLINFTDGDIYL